MAQKKTKMETQEIINFLRKEANNETIEGQLLQRQLIRALYKQVEAPGEKNFPDECELAGDYWNKQRGYTTYIEMQTKRFMELDNNTSTRWCIKRPSIIKVEIVEDYTRAGWSCVVQAHNVICTKYVKHPKYDGLWVKFYSSRDCNKYELVIEEK